MAPNNKDYICSDLPSLPNPEMGKILVTGVSGYIGGRLVAELLTRGYDLRLMVRAASPEYGERWPGTEIVAGDALDPKSLGDALDGIHTAFYLIHSLLLGPREFELADIKAAVNFRKVAEEKQIKRIIYLGGLGDTASSLSPHLMSRIRVAEELTNGPVPVTVLRAAVIIGSGSASFEIIKSLTENVPVFPIPSWAETRCQPSSIRDVIKYLVGVLETPETAGKSYDIGGRDILTYKEMIKILAGLLGKKRFFFHFPISNFALYAYVVSLFTPVPHPIIRCLIEGSINEVICQNDDIRSVVPFETLPFKEAIVLAMSREEQDRVHTRWSDAYPPAHELALKLHELETPPRYSTSYSLVTSKWAYRLFNSVCSIGGREGWFHSNWLWRLRGSMDRMLMGVGTSRGRRSHSSLRINDVIDFWRVEDLKKDQMLLLRAEMKLPGMAWLEFNIQEEADKNRLSVRAHYEPRGILGVLYWYACMPFHLLIFYDLIKQIEKKS